MVNESERRELISGLVWLGWIIGGATVGAVVALTIRAVL
jgi:hypothetical protein